MVEVKRTDIKIKSDPQKVIPIFLDLKQKKRITGIISNVASLDDNEVEKILNQVLNEFENRHIDFKDVILNHFQNRQVKVAIPKNLSVSKKLLIGAYFTKEYSIESAALFNPSIVVHPSQKGSNSNDMKFVMSLRATGEGHISSIVFRTGMLLQDGRIVLDKEADKLVAAKKNNNVIYQKTFIRQRARLNKKINLQLFNYLPDEFTEREACRVIADIKLNNIFQLNGTKNALKAIFDTNYEVSFNNSIPINSKVIFPFSKVESKGMEDVRFVEFEENGTKKYFGTYTAYNGKSVNVQLIKTDDFNTFTICSLYGKAAQDKGMALFPEKINGKYAMISRQGGNSISIMYSDDIHFWDEYKIIQKPKRAWEMTQIGNSGSPIKTSHGWLLLTHAVGPLRKYVLSASLLDLSEPENVLATLDEPLLSANSNEREGYVPNVVYTCGLIQHGENLFIPYAMSDSATSFVTVNLQSLLEKLLINIK